VVEATLFSPTIIKLVYSTYLCYNNVTFGSKNKTSVGQPNLKIDMCVNHCPEGNSFKAGWKLHTIE